MTDWERVEKLRARGATWSAVAADRRVGFLAPGGSDPGHALKALYFLKRSRGPRVAHSTEPPLHSPREREVRRRAGGRQVLLLAGVIVVALILAAYAYESDLALSGKPTGWVGRTAPAFSLPIANGGGTFTLASERNRTNVLLFFNEGLSCSPCLTQMEQLDADAASFQSLYVMIVAITGDSLSDMTAWAQHAHVTQTTVLADPTLTVSNAYDTTGPAVSMMPGAAPGHTFILVDERGIVEWRADYGPSDMSVPVSEIYSAVQSALGG